MVVHSPYRQRPNDVALFDQLFTIWTQSKNAFKAIVKALLLHQPWYRRLIDPPINNKRPSAIASRKNLVMDADVKYFLVVFTVTVTLLSLLLPVARDSDHSSSSFVTSLDVAGFPSCAGVAANFTALDTHATTNHRIIALGDVHGNHQVMLQVLHKAGITEAADKCEWVAAAAAVTTTLVQVGDIVDRGPQAPEAWLCLQHLQRTAPSGSEVVRLIGNHEIFWLQGNLRFRNKKHDTQKRTLALIQLMKEELCGGVVKGSHALTIPATGRDLLFVHAGLRPDMMTELLRKAAMQGLDTDPSGYTYTSQNISSSVVSSWINTETRDDACACLDIPSKDGMITQCPLNTPLYSAGSDRGGTGIGGVFWTDFRTLLALGHETKYRQAQPFPTFGQVVGHTAQPGSIRHTHGLSVICIDGGMQWGGRTYLEITPTGRFKAHEQVIVTDLGAQVVGGEWMVRDLTAGPGCAVKK